MKRLAKAIMWIIDYELWRYNVKMTYRYYQERKARNGESNVSDVRR